MLRTMTIVLLSLLASHYALALEPELNSVFLRVIDTGSGTATFTVVTGNTNSDKHYMIHDVGHWNDETRVLNEIRDYLNKPNQVFDAIDLMIVGHSDSDHLGAADTILSSHQVNEVVRTGWERPSSINSYRDFRDALAIAVNNGTRDVSLANVTLQHGTHRWALGDATVTFLSGFSEPPLSWDVGVPRNPNNSTWKSKARNSISIVVRLDFGTRSILYTSDAVGRKDGENWNQIIATEKFLVNTHSPSLLQADILFAPHHGADNASSLPFITAVNPEWVIFSAGNAHGHPKLDAYRRYRHIGVQRTNMFRTDRGDMFDLFTLSDKERNKRMLEWWADGDSSCRDRRGDDGISILIRQNGKVLIEQDPPDNPNMGC